MVICKAGLGESGGHGKWAVCLPSFLQLLLLSDYAKCIGIFSKDQKHKSSDTLCHIFSTRIDFFF